MKGSLRRALALLVAIMMVSTCMPLTALAEIIEASGSVQPFRVIQPDQGVYVTFEFYNGDEKVDTQIVTNGDTLYAPASPTREGYKFVGWKENGQLFTDFGVVSGYEAAESKRLDAAFEEVHYVFFLNEAGSVCATKEGIEGAVVTTDDVTFSMAADEGIAGWYYDAALQQPAGASVSVQNTNITLYPKVEKGYWLTFESDGGSYINPVFVVPGTVTVQPETPTRAGYTFLGWYNGNQQFQFGEELTASLELTARWQGQNVHYKVFHWWENANNDEYSFHESSDATGTAGTMTAATAKSYEGFTAKAVSQQVIEGDGTTIVNIYYDRIEYSVKFYKEEQTGGWWGSSEWKEIENLRITAKYGADIADQWPSDYARIWHTWDETAYQSGISTMPLNGVSFKYVEQSGKYTMRLYYYTEVLQGETGTKQYNGKWYDLDHTDEFRSSNTGWSTTKEDHYDITGFTYTGNLADGSAFQKETNNIYSVTFYYNRNSYNVSFVNGGAVEQTISKQYQADISEISYTPERPEAVPASYEFKGWYDNSEFAGVPYVFEGTMPAYGIIVYAKWAPPEVIATVHLTMAGTGETKTYDVPYGTKIDEENLPEVTIPEGYTWHGWATKVGEVYTPFNFDTVIIEDITLYPYYTSNASFSVVYDVNGGSGTVVDEKRYADRVYADVQYIAELAAPANQVFLGWNTAADGSGDMYQPGDKLLIAAEDANAAGEITLYAQWGGQAGTVELTYHANFTEAAPATKKETQLINNGVIIVSSYGATGLPERAGYEFIGWNTVADGTGTDFAVGESVRVNDKSAAEANHLYAQWEKKVATYTVQHYIQVLDAENKLQYELADEERCTADVGTSVNDELINALKKSNLTDADDGIGSPAYADGLYYYVYERNEAELAVYGQITSDADVIKLYYQRELKRTEFDDGVVSAEDAYPDDPNEIRQGVITVETHYVGGSKDGTGKTDKVYFQFNKSEMVDLKIAVNSDEYILNTITADLSGGNRWNGTVLDNVLGNSTVRIYLTPKYTLEYYKVENGEETRVYADVETKTYTLAPETTGTKVFVQTECPTNATLQLLPEEEGYTWNGWYRDAGLTGDTLPENSEQNINNLVEDTTEKVIKLYTGNKTANEYRYTIHHYLDGTWVKVAEDTTGTAAFGTDVKVNPATEFRAGFEKAQVKNSIPATITIKVDGNEATVYYTVPLTLTADGASKTYDGAPLTCDTFTADGLVNGDEVTDFALSMTAESTITNVGKQSNVIDEDTVTYKDGAIPSYYDVTYKPGTLTIEKRLVTVTVNTETYKYDGYLKTVADDNGQEYTVEGESEGRGLLNGDDISLNVVYGVYADEAQSLVGQYTADAKDGSIVISNANGDVTKNYVVTVVPGWLVITDGTEDDPVNPDAVLTKTHPAGVYDLGDVTFTITVKNIYNEAKTITIREQPGVKLIGADAEGKLVYQDVPADEQVTAYAKYTITEADILEGTFTNHVTAEFSDAKTYTNEDTVDIADLDTTLTVEKTSDVAEGATVGLGETINYTITVKNDGNVPYTGVKVVDDLAGLQIHEDARYTVEEDGTVTIGDLTVGETVTITASYIVTSDDIKAGHVLNAVTAAGDPIEDPKNPDEPKKPEGEDEEDDETDDLDTTLTVVKTSDVAEGEVAKEGQTIHYTITVTNEGNVPYTDVTVIDDMEGLVIDANDRYTVQEDGTVTVGGLAVGETVTITASYTVTADDILVGTVVNAATVSGDDVEDPKNPDEPKTPEGGDETEVTLAVDVPVTVHWVDGDQFYRPTAALTVQLIGNDGVVMDEVVVDPTTMGTDWTYTFENMPTHDENGDLIVYSVLEPVAPGNGRYDVTYNGLEVTNTAYVTVTFVDWNGAVLQNERILVGATGTVPESPRRVGYNFTQWSGGSWENVTRDQIIHANYMTVYEAIDELNIPLAGGTIQNVGDCFD